jgi:hypothetical protein
MALYPSRSHSENFPERKGGVEARHLPNRAKVFQGVRNCLARIGQRHGRALGGFKTALPWPYSGPRAVLKPFDQQIQPQARPVRALT